MGGGTRTIKFTKDSTVKEVTNSKSVGKQCNIKVPVGLPNNTSREQ
jgi:hypothetical protein